MFCKMKDYVRHDNTPSNKVRIVPTIDIKGKSVSRKCCTRTVFHILFSLIGSSRKKSIKLFFGGGPAA